ncbi:hypothetical protein [Chryseobacterium pennipullorum]|uniref:Uncharacterized protein n=1 Tax=Chryseobacterium pennipullorum TaxID=2258963 RepID=A0A3D9B2H3_9FLAO|nr:hypothetical protein [Chryseobacterium pennipullorum]REC47416.1 hypothetical protein DRF67_10235 [Chryseobacterium pennipullorum]
MKKIFSERKGFVIYSPELLTQYLQEHHLPGDNILKYFVENEHGDEITKQGIAIPIIGVEEDYYAFRISVHGEHALHHSEVAVESRGWIFQTTNNQMKIVGIGYLQDLTSINDENSITLNLENGWYSLQIKGGNKDDEKLFELNMQKKESQPDFSGDLSTEYYYA